MTIEESIKNALSTGSLGELFLGDLGWDRPRIAPFSVDVVGMAYQVVPVAQKSGLHLFDVEAQTDMPPAAAQAAIDHEIAKRSPERLLVCRTRINQIWRWPEVRPSGGTRLVPHEYRIASPNEDLIQRIARVVFSLDEQESLTLADVRARVRQSFNAEQVTKRFYAAFREKHGALLAGIEGIEDDAKRSWYASLLMNRLMFIYFMQRKGFVGPDRDFLRSCLSEVRARRGEDEFYGFYRDLLVPLFHDGFGSSQHRYEEKWLAELLVDVPYINGGIFEAHPIEVEHEIRVRDGYFSDIFDFFDSFTWHLDTSPTGDPREINPDVVGYVFEQYINLTTSGKRENGAYYTRTDVTGHMAATTVVPAVLERLVERTGVNPFVHLRERPDRYIHESRLHGWDYTQAEWRPMPRDLLAAWEDPAEWAQLDSKAPDPALVLAGETWVEAFDRRERVDKIRRAILDGELGTLDALITENLELRTLLTDTIRALTTPDDILAAWEEVSATTIVDPTCGSGAFLFAALDILDDVYAAILESAELHVHSGAPRAVEVLSTITRLRRPGQSLGYFRLKHAALNNLFGVDLMPEAIEIAKLRLFLALAARLESPSEIEPLPDLDFNLKAGNLLVGFRDLEDASGRVGCDLLGLAAVTGLFGSSSDLIKRREEFIGALEDGKDVENWPALKKRLVDASEALRGQADVAYHAAEGPSSTESLDDWRERSKPFHWFLEFPHVFVNGGFDVVVGNPPYVTMSSRSGVGYKLIGYDTGRTPDIYAPCAERAASLRRPDDGHFSMILPLSAAFSDDFSSLRDNLRRGSAVTWWSTFGRLPDGLFAGNARIRNTIVCVRGAPTSERVTYTTRHHVWPSEARSYLFESLEYSREQPRNTTSALDRSGRAGALVSALLDLPERRLEGEGIPVLCRPTGQYWVPVLPAAVPQLNVEGRPVSPDSRVKEFARLPEPAWAIAVAALAGTFGYAWWSAFGDDFDFTSEVVSGFVRRLVPAVSPSGALLNAARLVVAKSWDHAFYTLNAGKGYINVRYPDMRAELWAFDTLLARELGLDDAALRSAAIWYRQVMRGLEAGSKSRPLPDALLESLRGGKIVT